MDAVNICELEIVSDDDSCTIRKHNTNEIDIVSKETYGFNPGQNIDIQTNLKISVPDDKMVIVTTEKPLLLIGSPIFEGGKLTLRLHNSRIGKYGAHILSPGDNVCRLIVAKK